MGSEMCIRDRLTNAVVVLAFRLLFKVLLKLLKGSKKKNKSV